MRAVKASLSHQGDPSRPRGFRHFLQQDLARRCAGNEHYSLRSYARHLAIDHATLSQLLRGKRTLTARVIAELGQRLGLDAEAIARYQAVEAAAAGDDTAGSELRLLAQQAAELIADPFHFALLELVRVRGFRPDSRWIARLLGAGVDEVNVALQRLVRLDLLRMDGDTWVDRCGAAVAPAGAFPAAVLEALLARIRALPQRGDAAAAAPFTASTTIAIDRARVTAVVERLDRLRREITALLEHDEHRDAVYQLEIAFFPLTASEHQHG